ncbi:MAG: PQQ-dependent dehydrogenase, methanol/ethanol family [Acidobacteria bacterium]|nr:PQQ-dependent dehydrogenase, methanol/ethanol family [Acidobacteriota bacterium]
MKRAALTLLCLAAASAQVPYERIVNAAREPQNWLTYWGDYSAIRHRTLDQINTSNIRDMRLEWVFQTGQTGAFETVPLVVDGVMYLTAPEGYAFAVDARGGRQLWSYKYPIPAGEKLCCGTINRGLAILGDRLYQVTPNAHLIALDSRTGALIWDSEIAPSSQYYGGTLAPLAVKDKIVVGVAGGEWGIRGLIDAFDAATGKRAWRFWAIPGPGEPGHETWSGDSWKNGGAPTWMTGTYDPDLNLIYWGVGNPGPDLSGDVRKGDNLYSCSLVALDADTGKLKWHFQFTPHDTHDWDANETPMLLNLKWKGRDRKVVAQANRNGFFYLLDRTNGEFLMAKAFARQSWAAGFDEKGRPKPLPNIEPTEQGVRLCPGVAGAANWMAPSYNPATGWFYFPVREQCDVYYAEPPVFVLGKPYWGSTGRAVSDEKEWGLLKALDPVTGETKWDFRYFRAPWGGTMSTSGGLIFSGDEDGYFMAFDARTGKNLWKMSTGMAIKTAPITYMVAGRQYVTMPSGGVLLTFALPERTEPEAKKPAKLADQAPPRKPSSRRIE